MPVVSAQRRPKWNEDQKNYCTVATIPDTAVFIPDYTVPQLKSSVLKNLALLRFDIDMLKWSLCILYKENYTFNIFSQKFVDIVKESDWYEPINKDTVIMARIRI